MERREQDERFTTYVLPELDVLLRVARSLTAGHADAEDLCQETLLRAYRAIGSFDGRHPRSWLLTIMRNARINQVRRRRPDLLEDPEATFDRLADASPDAASAETLALAGTFEAGVDAALCALPPAFRQVVELVDVGGLSYREAADALDIPVGTVMSRLHRARRRVREALAAHDLAPGEHR